MQNNSNWARTGTIQTAMQRLQLGRKADPTLKVDYMHEDIPHRKNSVGLYIYKSVINMH